MLSRPKQLLRSKSHVKAKELLSLRLPSFSRPNTTHFL